jgi:predicted ATP-grasp superfamily ATP-dependent carboligase
MRVLVLDGNENQAVACVRSLARAQHCVVVGSHTSWSKAGWSRDCSGRFIYPAPQQNAEAFVERIVAEVEREPGTLVMPLTERTTLPLSAERERIFTAGGRMVMPSHETVLRAFDKQATTRLAASLGISTPRTVLINERNQIEQAASETGFPAVLKPRSSEEVTASGKVRTTGAPSYARNLYEFIAVYDEMRARCHSIIAQEFIPGGGEGYFALMRNGELRYEFAHRRIRDVRPTGSGSAVRESVYPDDGLRAAGVAILRALGWHGVAMVEFRRRPDGSLVFLEVNGRFWNSLPLAVYAGADFPAMLAEMAEYGDVRTMHKCRTGVRCRWLLGDFRHLLEVWRGAPPGYPGEYPNRWRALRDFLLPVPGTRHDNFTLRDPLPELGDWLDFAVRRLPAQWRKPSREEEELHVQRYDSSA